METPYGGLWYAARSPDGFRFGSVNRPSPPPAIYKNITSSCFVIEKLPQTAGHSAAFNKYTGGITTPSTQGNDLAASYITNIMKPILLLLVVFCAGSMLSVRVGAKE